MRSKSKLKGKILSTKRKMMRGEEFNHSQQVIQLWYYPRKKGLLNVPYNISHMFFDNAYEVKLPPRLDISPIFHVSNLHPYARVNVIKIDDDRRKSKI